MTDVKPASLIDGAIDAEETERVADAYFAAISAHDVDAAVAMWRPGGRENVRGQVDALAPEGVRDFLNGIIGPFPDLLFTIVEKTVQDDRAAYRWGRPARSPGRRSRASSPTARGSNSRGPTS